MLRELKIIILKLNNIFNSIYNTIILKSKNVEYHNDLKINGKIGIYGQGRIRIGHHVRINSCLSANPIGGNARMIIFAKANACITIGTGCAISNSALVSFKSINIDKNVYIGGNCKIYDTDFHSIKMKERLETPDKNIASKDVYIKEGAFIGAHSIILKGVTIGKNSVIGAGSVVTKDIPDGEIWAGNPAIFLKRLDDIIL